MKRQLVTAAFAITSFSATAASLSVDIYNADENSFHVTSAVVYGDTEAVVIDSGFTKADALRIAANVMDADKELTTIFISQADPDYYFGANTLSALFPDADVITTPAVRAKIQQKVDAKVAFWGPKMGKNAPDKPLIPDAYNEKQLTVNGNVIEIKGTEGALAHRPYLWIPSTKTILGNVAVTGDMHVWLADTQSAPEQKAWLEQLEEMQALKPVTVIPGHMVSGAPMTSDSITFTHRYISDFLTTKEQSKNSDDLINAMLEQYPNAAEPSSLELSAKVLMGEMEW